MILRSGALLWSCAPSVTTHHAYSGRSGGALPGPPRLRDGIAGICQKTIVGVCLFPDDDFTITRTKMVREDGFKGR